MRRIKVAKGASPFARQILKDPKSYIDSPQATVLKDDPKTKAVSITSQGGERVFVKLRKTNGRGFLRTLYTPLFKASRQADELLARGLPTPKAQGVLSKRRFGLLKESVIITDFVPHETDAYTYIMSARSLAERMARLKLLAKAIAEAHSKRVEFWAANPKNFLVQMVGNGPTIVYVDLDNIKIRERDISLDGIVHDFYRLSLHFHKFSGKQLTKEELRRMLEQYCQERPQVEIDQERTVNQIIARTDNKIGRIKK